MPDAITFGNRVDRISICCRTSQQTSSNALEWRRRLESIARTRLAQALERALEAVPEARNGKVLHIPVLELDFEDVLELATADDASLAEAWAKRIAAEVRKARHGQRFSSKSAFGLAALRETSRNVKPRQFWRSPLANWNPDKPAEGWLRAAGNVELPPPFCWLALLDPIERKQWAAEMVRGSSPRRWWQSLPKRSRVRLFELLKSPDSWARMVPIEGSLPPVKSLSPVSSGVDLSALAQIEGDSDVSWPEFVHLCEEFAGLESVSAKRSTQERTTDESPDVQTQDEPAELSDRRKDSRKPCHGWDIELDTTMAGAVLLWPFLDTFFKSLPDGDRLGPLHILVTGDLLDDGPVDPVLALLAGVDPEEELALSNVDFYSVCREADDVLEAFVKNLHGATGTSAQAIRETFLLRSGVVLGRNSEAGTTWQIRVEPRGVDVLLATLPYPTSFVKLPWSEPLIVEWKLS